MEVGLEFDGSALGWEDEEREGRSAESERVPFPRWGFLG